MSQFMHKKMTRIEKGIIDFLRRNILLIFSAVAVLLSVIIRFSLFDYISDDMDGYLLGWYGQIEQLGRIKALGVQVGNYNVLYQTLIALLTYFPGEAVVKYKILSCIFDYVCALGVFLFLYEKEEKASLNRALAAALFVLFSPIVFLNSAAWGQCDAMYTSFVLLSFVAYKKDKYPLSFIFFGLAFALKLQAVFFLPFYIFEWFKSKKFSCLNFLYVPLTMIFVCIPAYINGRGFWGFISPYYYQTGSCDSISFNYPSFWRILVPNDERRALSIETLKIPAIIITFVIIAGIMMWLLNKKLSTDTLTVSFLLMGYTCVLFLPGMHERYAFPIEVLTIPVAFKIRKTIPLAIGVNVLTFIMYGVELFGGVCNLQLMAIVNTVIFGAYMAILVKELLNSRKEE